jgi:2-phospho-L-lactate/phosphoenolpyruvate guanylyltransferase
MTTRAPASETWAIVPVKRFDRAKTRLSHAFSRGERRDLARAMLADVLETLQRTVALGGVTVVTSDVEAGAMARGRSFEVIADPDENGVSSAVAIGLRYVAHRGAEGALVIPADIPFVTAAEIGRVLSALDSAAVVVAPAARDGGTNILAMAPVHAVAPAFGSDSAARHIACAGAVGIEPAVLHLKGAGRDIDIPADLAGLGRAGAPRTRACLARIGALRAAGADQFERATR